MRLFKGILCLLSLLMSLGVVSAAQTSAATANSPTIGLMNPRALPKQYVGPPSVTQYLTSGKAQPVSISHADFNGDGVDGLVVGYAVPGGGIVSLRRGSLANRDSSPHFSDSAAVLQTPEAPDFVAAGQFLGQVDLVSAARGGNTLSVFAGNGHGSFAFPRSFAVPGPISGMATGSFGDDLQMNSIVVGTSGPNPALLLYRRSEHGLSLASSYPLPARASSIDFGDLDGDGYPDVVLVSKGKVLILHSNGSTGNPHLETLSLPFSAVAVASGYFTHDRAWRRQMAVIDSTGATHIVAHGAFDPQPWREDEIKAMRDALLRKQPNPFQSQTGPAKDGWMVLESFLGLNSSASGQAQLLVTASFAGSGTDDILVLNSEAQQGELISHAGVKLEAGKFATGSQSLLPIFASPTAAIVAPISPGKAGLVVLTPNSGTPLVVTPATSITFIVNTTNDTQDKKPGDGVCADSSGNCSLRAAVMEVDAEAAAGIAGPFRITLPAGNFQLTIPGSGYTTDASSGHLDVNAPLTIAGKSISQTTITQTNPGGQLDRVFQIGTNGPSYAVTLSNLTITGGYASYDNSQFDQGGGILWEAGTDGTGRLTLISVAVDGNFALDSQNPGFAQGGGLALFNYTANISTPAAVAISGTSNVENNTALDAGGGIVLKGAVSLTLTGATVSGNKAQDHSDPPGVEQYGGGLYFGAYLGNGKSIASAIHGSTISGNVAGSGTVGEGGGIWTSQSLTINQGSVITGNSAVTTGGGVETSLTLSTDVVNITDSTITRNTAGSDGGGIAVSSNPNPNNKNLQLSFDRIFGNTAVAYGSGVFNGSSQTYTANDNWWGCKEGPVAAQILSHPISIFNTGTTSTAGLASVSSADLHYTINGTADPSAPGPNAYVANPAAYPIAPNGPWVGNTTNSQWIAPTTNTATGLNPGDFVYQTTFSLTGLDPTTATLSGNIATDDSAAIFLNGESVGTAGGFGVLSGFTVNGGFIQGLNTLDFIINNAGISPNPTGLQVEFTNATANTAKNLCDQVYSLGTGNVITSSWITLANSASPSSVLENAPTTLTAAFQDSNPNFSSNLDPLVNLPVSFGNAINGNLSNIGAVTGTGASAAATFVPTASLSGRADVQIDNATATGTISVQDFALTGSAAQTISVGTTTATFAVSVAALNGFTGAVGLSVINSSGLSASLSAPSVTNEGLVILTVQTASAAAGTYSVTVTATGGSISHQVTVQLSIADFVVSISPSSQTVNSGSNAVYTVTVSSSTGFTGPITLSTTSITGATISFSQSIINLPSSSPPPTLTINAPAGTYSIVVQGTSQTGVVRSSSTVTLKVNPPPPPPHINYTVNSQTCTYSIPIPPYTVIAYTQYFYVNWVFVDATGGQHPFNVSTQTWNGTTVQNSNCQYVPPDVPTAAGTATDGSGNKISIINYIDATVTSPNGVQTKNY